MNGNFPGKTFPFVCIRFLKKIENFHRNFFCTKKEQQPQAQFNLILPPTKEIEAPEKFHQIITWVLASRLTCHKPSSLTQIFFKFLLFLKVYTILSLIAKTFKQSTTMSACMSHKQCA